MHIRSHFRFLTILTVGSIIFALGFCFWFTSNNTKNEKINNLINHPNSQEIIKSTPTTSPATSLTGEKELNSEKDCLEKKGEIGKEKDVDETPITVCILEDGFVCKEWGPFSVADCVKK